MKRPPRFHCFGHDHDNFGICYNKTTDTTLLNASAMNWIIKKQAVGLVFDILQK